MSKSNKIERPNRTGLIVVTGIIILAACSMDMRKYLVRK